MISEKRLEDALKYLADTDESSAKANANVKYLDRLLKRKKALHITGNKDDKSISAKEQTYYASDTYKSAIDELFTAEVEASTLDNKRDKEGLIIDLFRTLEASRRKKQYMIYKFKRWVVLPAYTEIIIRADSDEEALKIVRAIDPKTLNWQETDAADQRMTYEVIDENS